ncbi:hypothetical protein DFH08DRAFT_459916 [Mycena albidolilacea]|uniref:F-box domain-containing protein n=1 Tax=Mycena albidolilacea TaxID=1033008 RepID=A0AAD7AE45_9AGAR|nr:hypothetical protein DFH08DRAFT_459916 [Mycena albidolilacea]
MLSSLAADRARVADLDAQILFLERSLKELKSQRQPVLERLDSYKYPVLTLPTEITTEIFMHFLPTYPLCPPLTGLDSPTLLTQICHEWREIALGTAALWRAISISSLMPFEHQFRLSSMWLNRSNCSPLSLDLAIYLLRRTELLSPLFLHCARWQHLNLRRLSIPLLRMIQFPMPLLRSLDLFLTNDDPDFITAKVVFPEAHLLRTVVLNDHAAKVLTLPWVQLTSLTLHGVYPQECVPILRYTSNLVHCKLVLVDDDGDVTIPDITLPALQSLELTGYAEGYLKTLIVPALRDLRVSESFLDPECIETLAAFISKSRCQLQELCVTDTAAESRDSYRDGFPLITVSFGRSTLDS